MTKPLGYSLIYWWCLSLPPTTNFKITTHIEYAELSHENIYWCLYSKKPISSACFPLKIQWPFYTCHVIYICSLCSWNALTPLVPWWTRVSWKFLLPDLSDRAEQILSPIDEHRVALHHGTHSPQVATGLRGLCLSSNCVTMQLKMLWIGFFS